MIVIQEELAESKFESAGFRPADFAVREDEGVYSSLSNVDRYLRRVPGTVLIYDDIESVKVSDVGSDSDHVRVLVGKRASNLKDEGKYSLESRGYVLTKGQWVEDEVMIVHVREQLCSRWGGLLESDVLLDKRVFAPGLGSGGAPVIISLVQSGVGNFDLMDDDLLMVCNLMRHPLTLSDVGRYKTKAMADHIRDKNPYANVRTWEQKVGYDNIDLVRDLVRQADVVICGTDNRASKLLLNRLCVEEGTVLILGNAFRRAYGGQILRVRPGKSLCYQCYLQTVPEQSRDQEISNKKQAEEIAYSDCRVPIEPGLALDIAPLWQMAGKVGLMELLRGTKTTLASLYEDFVLQSVKFLFFLHVFHAAISVSSLTVVAEAVIRAQENFWPFAVKTYLFARGTFRIKPCALSSFIRRVVRPAYFFRCCCCNCSDSR